MFGRVCGHIRADKLVDRHTPIHQPTIGMPDDFDVGWRTRMLELFDQPREPAMGARRECSGFFVAFPRGLVVRVRKRSWYRERSEHRLPEYRLHQCVTQCE